MPRRRMLVVLSSVSLAPLAACLATADNATDTSGGSQDPDTFARTTNTAGGGPGSPTGTTTGTPSPPDAGGQPKDAGTPPHDSGTAHDTGTGTPDTGAGTPDTGTTGGCSGTPAGQNVGALASFAVNSWTGFDSLSPPLIVAHDSRGLFAYDALCTHAGCSLAADIDPASGQVTCPCHSWGFDGNGVCDRTTSSRNRNLKHYAVAVSCDKTRVYVNTGATVPASTRTSLG